jgi:hypothetical protein
MTKAKTSFRMADTLLAVCAVPGRMVGRATVQDAAYISLDTLATPLLSGRICMWP